MTRNPTAPKIETTSRCPPESVESVSSTRPDIPPEPFVPAPMRTSVSGAPSIARPLSVTSWPSTLIPCMRVAAGTVRCSPLIEILTGKGLRTSE